MAIIYQFNGKQYRSSGDPEKDIASLQKFIPDMKPDMLSAKIMKAYPNYRSPTEDPTGRFVAKPKSGTDVGGVAGYGAAKPNQESFGDWAARNGKGFVMGTALPGVRLAHSLINTPLDIAGMSEDEAKSLQGKGVMDSLGYMLDKYKSRYNEADRIMNKARKDAPEAYSVGHIAPSIVEYEVGSKALEGVPLLGKGNPTGVLGKLMEVLKSGGRSGITNAGIGQLESGGDLSRIPMDLALGAGGDIASTGLVKGAEFLADKGRKLGGRLIESTLKRPRDVIKQEMAQGDTLGRELYDRKVWGTQKGMARQAEKGLDKSEDALQALLKDRPEGYGLDDVINTNGENVTLRDSLTNYYNKIKSGMSAPGQVGAREQVGSSLDELLSNIGESKFTPSEYNKFKRDLYNEISDRNWLQSNPPLSKEMKMAEARAYKDQVAAAVPGAKALNQDLSTFGRLKGALDNLQASGQKSNFMKIMPLLAGTGAGLVSKDPATGIAATLGAMGSGTTIGKTGTARGIKLLMSLLGGVAKGSRYAAPVYTGLTADQGPQ